jgi:DNA-binding transcriptional regulator YbjK
MSDLSYGNRMHQTRSSEQPNNAVALGSRSALPAGVGGSLARGRVDGRGDLSVPREGRSRASQRRSIEARSRIINGAIEVLARVGVAGLTHRAVALAADVSLAATTYHFCTKQDILAAASQSLLDDYAASLGQLEDELLAGATRNIHSLDDVIDWLAWNALNREHSRSLAWCESVLQGGRSEELRARVKRWYAQCEQVLLRLGQHFDAAFPRELAPAMLDETIGLVFLLHGLHLDRSALRRLLTGRSDPEDLLTTPAELGTRAGESASELSQSRQRIIGAAVDVVIFEGVGALSYRSVAERINMVRSATSYYFPNVDSLLESTELELFERARNRYREGVGAWARVGIDEARLTDLFAAVLFRESLEFRMENLAYYEVWLRAARSGTLRSAAAAMILPPHRAWRRRLAEMTGGTADKRAPFRMQTLFVGKVIRAIVTGPSTEMLAQMPRDLRSAIQRATRPKRVSGR